MIGKVREKWWQNFESCLWGGGCPGKSRSVGFLDGSLLRQTNPSLTFPVSHQILAGMMNIEVTCTPSMDVRQAVFEDNLSWNFCDAAAAG